MHVRTRNMSVSRKICSVTHNNKNSLPKKCMSKCIIHDQTINTHKTDHIFLNEITFYVGDYFWNISEALDIAFFKDISLWILLGVVGQFFEQLLFSIFSSPIDYTSIETIAAFLLHSSTPTNLPPPAKAKKIRHIQ